MRWTLHPHLFDVRIIFLFVLVPLAVVFAVLTPLQAVDLGHVLNTAVTVLVLAGCGGTSLFLLARYRPPADLQHAAGELRLAQWGKPPQVVRSVTRATYRFGTEEGPADYSALVLSLPDGRSVAIYGQDSQVAWADDAPRCKLPAYALPGPDWMQLLLRLDLLQLALLSHGA